MKMNFIKWIFCGLLMFCQTSQAAILWVGGEDVDFPNGGAVCTTPATRSAYARMNIHACSGGGSNPPYSNAFSGGAVTSVWFSAQIWGADSTSAKYVGLTKIGTSSGLFLGTSASAYNKAAIWKYDGTTWTEVAAESTGTLLYDAHAKWDMEVINYGAAATVNVYINGSASPKLSYTGNVLAGGATSLDSVTLRGTGNWSSVSEIIVADSDTRKFSLATLAPNAAGDSNQWTGAYSNINPNTINDASVISDAVSGDNFQCNVTNLPTGSFQVLGVKVVARATQTGSGISSIALGVKTNTTVSVPSPVTLPVTWGTTESLYSTNPVTAGAWTSTEINALQINLQSAP